MYFVGIDLHKETSWFYVMDISGKKIASNNIPNNLPFLKEYFSKVPKPFKLAVEATYNWYYFVDLAREYADEVFLANSYELKSFAKRHKKTDKIDARLIADILRKGFLPVVTIADKKTREIRELLRYKISLIKDRSRNIFRLKSLLDKLGCNSNGQFTTYCRLTEVAKYKLTSLYSKVVNNYIDRIIYLTEKAKNIEKEIEKVACKDKDIVNLMSIPGLSYFGASLVKTEIIDINRFASFNRLCAYAGLAPRVSKSANKIYHGSLNINRRKNLQWILIENVHHFIKSSSSNQKRYLYIESRKGHNTAKVIFAREMLKVIYHILKEKRAYY